jgi:ankyrin repeat protein
VNVRKIKKKKLSKVMLKILNKKIAEEDSGSEEVSSESEEEQKVRGRSIKGKRKTSRGVRKIDVSESKEDMEDIEEKPKRGRRAPKRKPIRKQPSEDEESDESEQESNEEESGEESANKEEESEESEEIVTRPKRRASPKRRPQSMVTRRRPKKKEVKKRKKSMEESSSESEEEVPKRRGRQIRKVESSEESSSSEEEKKPRRGRKAKEEPSSSEEESEEASESSQNEDIKTKPKKRGRPKKAKESSSEEESEEPESESEKMEDTKEKPKRKPRKDKKEKKLTKPKVQRVLAPNPELKVITKNPLLEPDKNSTYPDKDISLICNNREPIFYVCKGDIKGLKNLIKSPEGLSTFFQPYSIDINKNALQIAMEKGKREMVSLLVEELLKESNRSKNLKRAEAEHIDVSFGESGVSNNFQYGFRTKKVAMSRGGREGNMALVADRRFTATTGRVRSLFDTDIPFEYAKEFFDKKIITEDNVIYSMKKIIRCGNYKTAQLILKTTFERQLHGFCKLHYEVLMEKGEPERALPSSILKKSYHDSITPLHVACINPNIAPLKKLLGIVSSYDIGDAEGYKPIHYAAVCVDKGPLEYLISRRIVNLNSTTSTLLTPLMIACKYGREKNVKLLLAESKKLMDENEDKDKDGKNAHNFANTKTKRKETPCHFAAAAGNLNIIKLLFDSKADFELLSSAGKTPLMIAAACGHLDCVKFMVEEAKVNALAKNKKKKTAATFAVMNGHLHVVSYLMRIGVDPNG